MKTAANFLCPDRGDAHRLVQLFSAVEFFFLLFECSKLFAKGLFITGSVLFLVGVIGIRLVDWFLTKAIDAIV
jgi:hypothetical protein